VGTCRGEWGHPGVWWADSKWWRRKMLRPIGTRKRGCVGSLFFFVCKLAVNFLCCCGNLIADNKCARTKNARCSQVIHRVVCMTFFLLGFFDLYDRDWNISHHTGFRICTVGFGLNRDSVATVQKILYVEIYQHCHRQLRWASFTSLPFFEVFFCEIKASTWQRRRVTIWYFGTYF
jgi:hypothetical protein